MTGFKVKKHSVRIAGHATSVTLEEPFWEEVQRLAQKRNLSIARFIAYVDEERHENNLSSALRVSVLQNLKAEIESLKQPLDTLERDS